MPKVGELFFRFLLPDIFQFGTDEECHAVWMAFDETVSVQQGDFQRMNGGTDGGKIGWENFVILILVEGDVSFVYVISKLRLNEMAFHIKTEKQGGKVAHLVIVLYVFKTLIVQLQAAGEIHGRVKSYLQTYIDFSFRLGVLLLFLCFQGGCTKKQYWYEQEILLHLFFFLFFY